jgi:F-type H+-transporting ATPase subunit a
MDPGQVSDVEDAALQEGLPYLVVINLTLASLFLIGAGAWLARGALTRGVPDGRQNFAEWVMDFFVGKARAMGDRHIVMTVAPFLATCFLLILVSNAIGMLPIPMLNYPPTAFFGVTLGLAICAVAGTLVLSGVFNGLGATLKHLVWPNPLQIISEITDVLSLSLRLFGNMAGHYLTLVLVTSIIAILIPLILHTLGLIPTFVQAFLFTLLTASYLAGVIHRREERERQTETEKSDSGVAEDTGTAGVEGA